MITHIHTPAPAFTHLSSTYISLQLLEFGCKVCGTTRYHYLSQLRSWQGTACTINQSVSERQSKSRSAFFQQLWWRPPQLNYAAPVDILQSPAGKVEGWYLISRDATHRQRSKGGIGKRTARAVWVSAVWLARFAPLPVNACFINSNLHLYVHLKNVSVFVLDEWRVLSILWIYYNGKVLI